MEAREKLVDLIVEKEIDLRVDDPHIKDTIRIGAVVDHLIANGVTVQQWIPASEPPEDWKGEGGYLTNYYVYTPEYGTDIGNYMGAADRWLCMGIPCNVTHWMPLPESPK